MIFIIDSNKIMAECIRDAAGVDARIFNNVIDAINATSEETPEMIFMDVLLDGPDAFTFLNEMASYTDTAGIPVVVVSSLKLRQKELEVYGVVRVLDKDTMTPKMIKECVAEYINGKD